MLTCTRERCSRRCFSGPADGELCKLVGSKSRYGTRPSLDVKNNRGPRPLFSAKPIDGQAFFTLSAMMQSQSVLIFLTRLWIGRGAILILISICKIGWAILLCVTKCRFSRVESRLMLEILARFENELRCTRQVIEMMRGGDAHISGYMALVSIRRLRRRLFDEEEMHASVANETPRSV